MNILKNIGIGILMVLLLAGLGILVLMQLDKGIFNP